MIKQTCESIDPREMVDLPTRLLDLAKGWKDARDYGEVGGICASEVENVLADYRFAEADAELKRLTEALAAVKEARALAPLDLRRALERIDAALSRAAQP